ncbi:hypothetical protein P802_03681 [Klebsiella pneumoniae BIDMC 42b]|nr:hypothetical protein P802_03681 [Klebsiella pneumoniae BIDMC 42b]EWE26679.1 hypothetical protein P801_03929 [Klebsiella pneumoniae BIDMC 42a]EWE98002.1 hypothetical protein L434_05719 [Klebsiella pneumoniae BIDMC 7B]EWF25249.1 hypothetical protein L405_04136 [Klebsiella pneumoniae BWH 36]EWG04502.1 hypothetical protein L433_05711 [Klebsiella pneumoniae BIDMC 7A]
MSRYDELRSAALRKSQKEDLYWSGLYKVYNKFNKDFSEFLGVNNEIIKDSSNERIPVLRKVRISRSFLPKLTR